MSRIVVWDPSTALRGRLVTRLSSMGHAATGASSERSFVETIRAENAEIAVAPRSVIRSHCTEIRTAAPEIAVVGLASRKDARVGEFSGLDVDHLITLPASDAEIACRLAVTLKNRKRQTREQEERKRLETIVEITSLTSSILDAKEILFLIVRKISEIIPVTRCSIIRIDDGADEAVVVASFEDSGIRDIRLTLSKYPEIREALTSRKPVVIKDVEQDPLMDDIREILSPLGIRAIVVLPIMFRQEVIGTLFLRTSRTDREFSDEEISLCQAVANASSNALYNAFLFERIEQEKHKLERLAITDFLTGLYNIRYFYHRLEQEFVRAKRYEIPLACLMMDIDHFKKINDTYGHRKGDMILREFSATLKNNVRASDILARYGGEEFIVLLPQTDLAGGKAEGERLRQVIKKHRFKSMKRRTGITMSAGMSVFPHDKITSSDDLITFADEALFRAKNRGRDRLSVFK